MDLDVVERLLVDSVSPVVAALPFAPADRLMVVGAVARDLLHAGWGRTTALRRTSDLDLALGVSGPAALERVTTGLERVPSSSGVRYLVAGVRVDLVPFGEIEDPQGFIGRGPADEPMSVFGFQEVWRGGLEFIVAGRPVRLPSTAGYAALKLKAWADRSTHGEYKDAQDLACALSWYQQHGSTQDRLFDTEEGNHLLAFVDFDTDRASNLLLLADVRELLGTKRVRELQDVWQDVDDGLLADNLVNSALSEWPNREAGRRLDFVHDLRTGVHG